jgi:catechol 2,3-dioxygenase-like lactoylglutathione lyase family enzyme
VEYRLFHGFRSAAFRPAIPLGELDMRFLHTMLRVSDLDASLDFYCAKLGLKEVRRRENEKGRFTLVFLAAPGNTAAAEQNSPLVELTSTGTKKLRRRPQLRALGL